MIKIIVVVALKTIIFLHNFTYVDEVGIVTGFEVVKDGGLVKVGKVAHVLALFKFWRVHLLHLILLENALLFLNLHGDFVSVGRFDNTIHEPSFLDGHPT